MLFNVIRCFSSLSLSNKTDKLLFCGNIGLEATRESLPISLFAFHSTESKIDNLYTSVSCQRWRQHSTELTHTSEIVLDIGLIGIGPAALTIIIIFVIQGENRKPEGRNSKTSLWIKNHIQTRLVKRAQPRL